MKMISKFVLSLAGFASLGGAIASASDTRLVVNVPFEFVAAGVRLPAGEYRFINASEAGVILLAGRGAGHSVALMTTPGTLVNRDVMPGANFKKMDGETYLSEI